MSDEAAGVRYAIPAHRKEGLTAAEAEDFVSKQMREISAAGLILTAKIKRMLRFFREDNALVATIGCMFASSSRH